MKKFFKYLLLTIVVLILLVIVFGDLNTAHIANVKVCTELSGESCENGQAFFQTNSPQIVVSCELKNPPTNTQVEFSWNYLSKGLTKIDAVTLSSGDHIGTINMHSILSRPNNGWPRGDYEIIIRILDTDKEPLVKRFSIK